MKKKLLIMVEALIISVLLFSSSLLNAQNITTQQSSSDTITYWLGYNFDNLAVNDYDSIWNVRCFINIPSGIQMKKFNIKITDITKTVVVNSSVSPSTDSMQTAQIISPSYTTPKPKRNETSYNPSFLKNANTIVVDFGFHRNSYYLIEIKPKDNKGNDIKKVKKIRDIK